MFCRNTTLYTTGTIVFSFIITIMFSYCKADQKDIYDYQNLHYDSSRIAIFHWDSTIYTFTNYSEPTPITTEDLQLVDSLIKDKVDSFNINDSKRYAESFNYSQPVDSFMIDLSRYKRQYFPYKDVNGQRIFNITLFFNDFPAWRTEYYRGRLHQGTKYIFGRINLTEKKLLSFIMAAMDK